MRDGEYDGQPEQAERRGRGAEGAAEQAGQATEQADQAEGADAGDARTFGCLAGLPAAFQADEQPLGQRQAEQVDIAEVRHGAIISQRRHHQRSMQHHGFALQVDDQLADTRGVLCFRLGDKVVAQVAQRGRRIVDFMEQ